MKPAGYPQEPKHMWQRFYELTQVPRPSKKEEKVRQYLIDAAKKAGMEYRTDKVGNVFIYIPATPGYETHAPLILQSHMDMVCDKVPGSTHDFDNDPLKLKIDNGWIRAIDTTLGADNGFGCAVMLACLDDKTLKHPPLELLFTVDEETGLHGALNLDASLLTGRRLLNIDTEEWGAAYVGCAGGIDYKMRRKLATHKCPENYVSCRVDVGGLKGGHSGMDIIWGRGNAIKILGSLIYKFLDFGVRLVEFSGGRAHNIIPRDAYAVVNLPADKIEEFKKLVEKVIGDFKAILPQEDQGVFGSFKMLDKAISKAYSESDTDDFMRLLSLFPHGAHAFNWQASEPLVSSSNNLAICQIIGESLFIESSLRFFDRKEAVLTEEKLTILGLEYGLDVAKEGEYPSWKPVFDGALLKTAKEVHGSAFGEELKVKAIHAGLECGIIKDRLGELDALSIGPNLLGVHSPTEGLEISSSNQFWKFFVGILERL